MLPAVNRKDLDWASPDSNQGVILSLLLSYPVMLFSENNSDFLLAKKGILCAEKQQLILWCEDHHRRRSFNIFLPNHDLHPSRQGLCDIQGNISIPGFNAPNLGSEDGLDKKGQEFRFIVSMAGSFSSDTTCSTELSNIHGGFHARGSVAVEVGACAFVECLSEHAPSCTASHTNFAPTFILIQT